MSEESGIGGDRNAPVTVVLDPVDGSTNCAHDLAYWATSLCALDGKGMWAALVANHATGEVFTAIRGAGAFRDGLRLHASPVKRIEDALVVLSGWPRACCRGSSTGRSAARRSRCAASRPAVSTATSTVVRGTHRGTTSAAS